MSSSLDSSDAAITEVSSSDDSIDIGYLVAPLARDRLELFLADLISRHPEEFPSLLSLAQRPVDRHELLVTTQNALSIQGYSVFDVIGDILPLIERSLDYSRANHWKNCIQILEIVCSPVIDWIKDQSTEYEPGDEEWKSMEHLLQSMESSWQAAIVGCPVQGRERNQEELSARNSLVPLPADQELTIAQLMNFQEKLNKFKTILTPSFGPLFSDPLRSIRRKLGDQKEKEIPQAKRAKVEK
jgi:hypothetical protein